MPDQRAADAGADEDAEHAVDAPAGAEAQLAERRSLDVVAQRDRQGQALAERRADRQVEVAAEVGRGHQDAALRIDLARRSDADALDAGPLREFRARERLLSHVAEPVEELLGTLLGPRPLLGRADDRAALQVDHAGQDLGPPEIDAQAEVLGHASPLLRPAQPPGTGWPAAWQ